MLTSEVLTIRDMKNPNIADPVVTRFNRKGVLPSPPRNDMRTLGPTQPFFYQKQISRKLKKQTIIKIMSNYGPKGLTSLINHASDLRQLLVWSESTCDHFWKKRKI